ncbi:MFS general substrate transporter [Sanghuangporus baumii]|uniref:MFS general substrate transporter n=1 Tax=Sanghuangporus baumii TaxID=108892 RepID=A0A9Q5I0N1_SANBA|nr:MFS general substrate transporter [Sanghuangporus baumii]
MSDSRPTLSSAGTDQTSSRFSTALPQLAFNDSGNNSATGAEHKLSTEVDVERRSVVPTPDSAVDDKDSIPSCKVGHEKLLKRKRLVQFLVLCWTFIFEGWSDASLGPLLPSIQGFYGVKYSIVSLIFFFLCITIAIGAAGQIIGYSILVPAFPFPVTILAYTLYGFARMMENSQVNAFVVGLNNPSKMGILQTAYGVGALVSPFVATRFATTRLWNFYYLTSLGLNISVVIFILCAFRLKTINELYVSSGVPLPRRIITEDKRNVYRQLSGIRALYFCSLFAFAYIGVEITLGGWTVTYLIDRTGADSSAGYVSSGFFGGLALGRVLLLWVNKKVGEQRVTILYGILAIALEAVIWAVPHFIASAILVSFVGLLMGPMFPILMNQCGSFFPPRLLSGGIGSVVGAGTLGGALVPFVTGTLADRFGVTSMQPLVLAMMIFMILMWVLVVYDNHRSSRTQTALPSVRF